MRLDPEAIQPVLNLVSAAIPGLKPQAIAIIDNHGNVLARNGAAVSETGGFATSDEMRQAMELRLSHQVEEMLDASLGPDKVRAETSVTLDNSQINETQESYDPDQQVLRSQQTSSDKNRNTEAQPTTTVANNLPNADAGRVQAGSQDDRREETSNYEIGKTTRTLTQSAPRVQRLSIAVLVDGQTITRPDGKPVWKAREPAELARMAALVKSAIGFDAKRGDTVTVDSMRFDATDETSDETAPQTPFGLGIAEPDLLRLLQTGLIGFVTLIVGLFVFRPLISQLSAGSVRHVKNSGSGDVARLENRTSFSPDPQGRLLLGPPATLETQTTTVQRLETDMLSRVDISQTRNSSTRRLSELVERYPDESLNLVRAWLAEGAA